MSQVPDLRPRIARAVAHYWQTRRRQSKRQRASGQPDQGARGAVTGGAQMDGFIELFTELLVEAGVDRGCIFYETALELPGFFRPTKKWDLLVVRKNQLLVALEAKSQTGPSFGNNFNNRTEEAVGSAVDLWTAYREGAFNKSTRPWLGYLFLLESCAASLRPVAVAEPHFPVFPEFQDASYACRYELFCRKLARERHYDAAAFLMADARSGVTGSFTEPADDLAFVRLAKSLGAHVSANWSLT